MSASDEVAALYGRRGAEAYVGESVSVTAHCLQTANLARLAQAPDALVVAALLHDIGHLIDEVSDDGDWTRDARHELSGSRWLAERFGPEVSEPVRLHVPAKRYLCASSPGYVARLSPASLQSLGLQGGAMSRAEVEQFELEPYARCALRLRVWDDEGKVPARSVPELDDYRGLIDRLAVHAAHR